MNYNLKWFGIWLIGGIILISGMEFFASIEYYFGLGNINLIWFKMGGFFTLGMLSLIKSFIMIFKYLKEMERKMKQNKVYVEGDDKMERTLQEKKKEIIKRICITSDEMIKELKEKNSILEKQVALKEKRTIKIINIVGEIMRQFEQEFERKNGSPTAGLRDFSVDLWVKLSKELPQRLNPNLLEIIKAREEFDNTIYEKEKQLKELRLEKRNKLKEMREKTREK